MLALVVLMALVGLGGPASLGAREASASAQTPTFALSSVVATTTGLNLRDQPAADGQTIVVMPINTKAVVIGGPFNDGWYWLSFDDKKGYALGKYLVLVDERWTPLATETPTPAATPSAGTATSTPSAPSPVTTAGPATSPSAQPAPDYSAPTMPGDYTGLWIGEMTIGGNVRSGPGLTNKVIKGWWAGRRVLLYQAVADNTGATWYRVSEPPEPPMWVHSSLVRKVMPVQFEPARYKSKWINVNVGQQVVTVYEGAKPVKVTLVSTGKAATPTEIGIWKIYWRLPKQTMEGGNLAAGDYYRLEDVPFPQYFHMSGESFHGTYWHDNFGVPMSHGCVNMSTPMAGWLYGWANIGTIVRVVK